MKYFKILFLLIFTFFCYKIETKQIVLFNETSRPMYCSFKFYHKKAGQKMWIKDFRLLPREQTKFPQEKDLYFAEPLKISIKHTIQKDAPFTALSVDFSKKSFYKIIEKNDVIELVAHK